MKKILLALVVVLIAGLIAFCFQPDPSAEWHEFRDAMAMLESGSEYRLVEERSGGSEDEHVEKHIPLAIRLHPRRSLSEAWQRDFVGLSIGLHTYVFSNGENKITSHVYSIRQRTCAVDVVCARGQVDAATTLANAIRSKYPRMHIRIGEQDEKHNKASHPIAASRGEV